MTRPEETDLSTDDEAKERFKEFAHTDPFPEIAPALLNSEDIHKYIEKTGMIFPYYTKFLKSSSYEVQIGGKAIYWEENTDRKEVMLDCETDFVDLKPNSLMFFSTLQRIRLPDYMAIRFNLRITNVHRGLLLGTGPLVDPGFEGRLAIPVHNLTANEYRFHGQERLIWVEFTKISPNRQWTRSPPPGAASESAYVPFDPLKKDLSIEDYLAKAAPNKPIGNAVPFAVAETKQNAEKAQRSALQANEAASAAEERTTTIRNTITWGGLITVVALGFALGQLFNDYAMLAQDTTDFVASTRADLATHLSSGHEHYDEFQQVREDLDALDAEILKLSAEMIAMEEIGQANSELSSVSARLASLETEILELRSHLNALDH